MPRPRLLEALQELLRGLHPSFQRADESAKALVVGGQVANLQALLHIDILTSFLTMFLTIRLLLKCLKLKLYNEKNKQKRTSKSHSETAPSPPPRSPTSVVHPATAKALGPQPFPSLRSLW